MSGRRRKLVKQWIQNPAERNWLTQRANLRRYFTKEAWITGQISFLIQTVRGSPSRICLKTECAESRLSPRHFFRCFVIDRGHIARDYPETWENKSTKHYWNLPWNVHILWGPVKVPHIECSAKPAATTRMLHIGALNADIYFEFKQWGRDAHKTVEVFDTILDFPVCQMCDSHKILMRLWWQNPVVQTWLIQRIELCRPFTINTWITQELFLSIRKPQRRSNSNSVGKQSRPLPRRVFTYTIIWRRRTARDSIQTVAKGQRKLLQLLELTVRSLHPTKFWKGFDPEIRSCVFFQRQNKAVLVHVSLFGDVDKPDEQVVSLWSVDEDSRRCWYSFVENFQLWISLLHYIRDHWESALFGSAV